MLLNTTHPVGEGGCGRPVGAAWPMEKGFERAAGVSSRSQPGPRSPEALSRGGCNLQPSPDFIISSSNWSAS